ncbi:MAG: polyphosphate polymerase domain-containing protein [Oscillospiraceae bacterium]
MAYSNTFKRTEVKYLLTCSQYLAVRQALAPYMTEDCYGKHTICNIYCDSDNNDLIRTSLEKPVYKEKLRLRTYGTPKSGSTAFLEIKKKFKGTVYKRRAELKYDEAWNYLMHGTPPAEHSQQLDEIDYMIKRLGLKPKIVICYDRRAFFANDDREFRVTFDSCVRSRTTRLDLRNGDSGERLACAPDYIMEIKVSGAMPLWITRILSELGIYHGSFSKYGSIFLNSAANNIPKGDTTECLTV